MNYILRRSVFIEDDLVDKIVSIPDNAILMKHAIVVNPYYRHEKDLIHIISWLEPYK